MYNVHCYVDDIKVIDWRMEHIPRTGDTVRFSAESFVTVTEVIWCIDEDRSHGERVNIRMVTNHG